MINFQYIFNLFLNRLKSSSSLANLMGEAPPIDQLPRVSTRAETNDYFDNQLI